MLSKVAGLKAIALGFIFPQWCLGCGREGALICDSCRQSLERLEPPVCPLCGRPQAGASICPGCVNWKAEIDGIRSPFIFGGVMRQAIHQLKYRNLRALTAPLAGLLADYLIANPLPAGVLVPVPLHEKRLRERGYNQAGLLARGLGRLINLPVAGDCLIRARHTTPQARTSSVDERRHNTAGAFACLDRRLSGTQVLLIDDVSTSGATLDSCAAALKASGVHSVWGLAMAREI